VDVTCAFDPHAAGPDFPVRVGQTWDSEYTGSCDDGGGSIAYRQQGSVVDIESVSVLAGTFMALKLQSTITWTDSHGTMRTETATNWRDIKTLDTVKESLMIEVSGTMPAGGYAVSREIQLESIS
jgi:hypothetical protein